MKKRLLRAYTDASVFGGVFDKEFDQASRTFFDQVREGKFRLVTSAIVQAEIENAPSQVKKLFDEMLEFAEIVNVTESATRLAKAYLDARIVTPKWETDALHVAVATVSTCSLIVSWNFTHIVHFDKIGRYNAVNTLNGQTTIAIHSPQEVILYEEDL